MRYLSAMGCRGGLATVMLGAMLATGCGAGPMARLAEFRRDRAVEKAIDEDPFPTAAEAGLVASDGHTHLE